jgi:hypothetical protein
MRRLLILLMLSGCATTQHRFPMEASADQIRSATQEAASRLGWSAEVSPSGQLHVSDTPVGPLAVTPESGALVIEARPPDIHLAPLLAATSRQVLTNASGAPVTRRSLAGTVALDLLLPGAGTLYLGPEDLGQVGLRGTSFGVTLAARLMADAVAGVNLWLSSLPAMAPDRGLLLGISITTLLLNRVLAMVQDVLSVQFRNGLAERGVSLPTAEAVWRERTAIER